jgi:tyrosyl-tRNA synthetase
MVDCVVSGLRAGLFPDQPQVGSGPAEDPTVRALKQGTVEVVGDLQELLKMGRPLRVKCGFDPTAPDLHLGHAVLLRKMRQFQDLGHEVIFVIGDFTALIGDPTGRNTQRPALSKEEIFWNAETFKQQVFRILDEKRTRVVWNSEWTPSPSELVKLMATHTLSQMLEREDFSKRFESEQPIHLHELLYPLLQGFDSVALEADVELGGTDQTFNLHAGRELQRQHGQRPQVIITMPIINGTDGVNKMSKSLGNHIGLAEAASSQFAKVMSVSDETAKQWRQVLTSLPDAEEHPKTLKKELARAIVEMLHSWDEADRAQGEWEAEHERREQPEMETVTVSVTRLDKVLVAAGLAKSNSDANRMIRAWAVSVDGTKQLDNKFTVPESAVLRLGRNWKRVQVASMVELGDTTGREPVG